MDSTDETLIDQLLSHRDWIRRLAERLVTDPHRAADVVQEAWLRTLRRPPRHGSHLKAWLARVVRSVIREDGRASSRRRRREEAEALPSAQERPEQIVQRIQLEQDLVRAVMRLPRAQRDVILLRFYDGLTVAETALRLGIPPGTVESRQHRAVATLRGHLARTHDERTWAALLGVTIPIGEPGAAGEAAGVAEAVGAGGPGAAGASTVGRFWGAKTAAALVLAGCGGAWWWTTTSSPPREVASPPAVVLGARERDPSPPRDAPPPVVRAPEPSAVPVALAPAAASDVDAAAGCAVRVVANGRPAAARVILFDDGLILGPETTDAGGVATFSVEADANREVQALVLPEVGLPELHPIVLAGEHALALTVGTQTVRGRVTVDGRVPARPVPLLWVGDARLAWMESLPGDVRLRAKLPFDAPQRQVLLTTGADGAFELSGLDAATTGGIFVKKLYHVEGTSRGDPRGRVVEIVPPVDDLVIHLQALPALRGRVVDEESYRPLPGQSGMAHVMFRDGRQSALTLFLCEDDGSFEVEMAPSQSDLDWSNPELRSEFEEVRLWFSRGGVGEEFTFEGRALPPGGDVGTLAVPSGATVRFRVLDPSGAPIEGARAWAGSLSEPTDAEGYGTVTQVAPDASGLTAGAPGHRTITAPIAPASAAPVVVTLPRANALEVRVDETAARGSRLVLRVESEAGLLPDDGDAFRLRREFHWKGVFRSRFRRARTVLSLAVPRSGVVLLEDLVPGRPFTVALDDPVAGPLASIDVGGLAEFERRTLDVPVDREAWRIDGDVVDASGAPAGAARVTLSTSHGKSSVTAGVDGRFSLGPLLLAAGARAELQAEGAAGASEPLEVRGPSSSPKTLRLSPRKTLEVRVVDVTGTPVVARAVTLSLDPGASIPGERVEPARFLFPGLPSGATGELEVAIGGRAYRFPCSTAVPRRTMRVPRHGELEVRAGASAVDGVRYVDARVRGGDVDDRFPLGYDAAGRRAGAAPYLPGTYEVSVSMPYADPPRDLPPRTVVVRAGERVEVEFAPAGEPDALAPASSSPSDPSKEDR